MGSTATEALAMVKEAIGSDAILLSNREVEGGIEIIAMAQEQFKQIAPRSAARDRPKPPTAPVEVDGFTERLVVSNAADRAPRPEGLRLRSDSAMRTANHKIVIADVAQKPMRNPNGSPVFSPEVAAQHFRTAPGKSQSVGVPTAEQADPTLRPAVTDVGVAPPVSDQKGEMNLLAERLMGQVSEVKQLLQEHIAGNNWSQLKGVSPRRAEMLKRLLSAGFSPGLSTSLLEEVADTEPATSFVDALKQPLASRMRKIDPVSMFDEGGVFAFIGPTGVGKTTTVAKIAARCVMRFGRKSVALLSTDTYRIGALEQLRVFGKILGLPVTALRDAEDLSGRLAELERYHVVLIDTAGMGQRDAKMLEQLRVLSEGHKLIKRILVMSATTSLQTMQDVIQAHSNVDGNTINAAVITKIDEAMGLAPSVDCLIRHDLPLLFIGNGQQVPEDLHVADPMYLAHRALQPRVSSREFEPGDEMVPLMIADNIAFWVKARA